MPAPDLNRSSNVLECLCAAIVKCGVETVAHILMHSARYANPAGCRDFLEPGGDVDPVAEDVVAVDDDVAEVDANAERDATVLGPLRGAISHRRLQFDGTAHCIDHARELNEQPVARGLHNATAVAGNGRVDHLLANCFQ